MPTTRMGLAGFGVRRAGSFDGRFKRVTWTLVLNFDPTWIGNSPNCVHVTGFLMSQNVEVAPWIPPGMQ